MCLRTRIKTSVPPTTETATQHTYATPGTYVVKLTVSGARMETIVRAETLVIVE